MTDPAPRYSALSRRYASTKARAEERKRFIANATNLVAMGVPVADVLKRARKLGTTIREAFEERP